MSIGIHFAARSDVGMLREGNEDSAYAGTHLLAVADGMGGHVGGEIASAAAIESLRRLDTDLPAAELLAALEHTVKAANEKLHSIVESDPALQGMGTTLTAMLWSGNQVALVHIGDSRAYLLRDGSLFQITHDHTLVQSLVDEGRISPDEAASHPQRSLLLRALDGRGEVDPDLSLREAQVGDRYLLCSDGLSSVVTAETIFQVLTEVSDPDQAVRQLIDLANRGGGPDNITCVVADVVDVSQQQAGERPVLAGAAANASASSEAKSGPGGTAAGSGAADTPAQRAAQLRDTMPQPPVVVDEMPVPAPGAVPEAMEQAAPRATRTRPDPAVAAPPRLRQRRRWTWLIVALGAFVVIVVAAGVFGIQSMRSGYYLAAENNQVVLFKGSPDGLLGLNMSSKAGRKDQPSPPLLLEDLTPNQRTRIQSKMTVDGPDGWKTLVRCGYVVKDEGGKVFIFKGLNQQDRGCQQGKVDGKVDIAQLPSSKVNDIKKGIPAPTRQQAETIMNDLKGIQAKCQAGGQGIKDCPSRSPGGGKP